jgi:hypothetical protein
VDLVDLLTFLDVEGEVMKSHFVDFERMAGELGLCFPDIDRDAAQPGQNVNRQPLPIGILNDLANVVAKELEERFEKFHRLAEVSDGDGNVIDRSSQHLVPRAVSTLRRKSTSVTTSAEHGRALVLRKPRVTRAIQPGKQAPGSGSRAQPAHLAKVTQFEVGESTFQLR